MVSCMSARDTRALDKVSLVWKAANATPSGADHGGEAEGRAAEAEVEAVRANGGLGRLPTFKEQDFDFDMDDLSSIGGSFGGFESTSEDGGEGGRGERGEDEGGGPEGSKTSRQVRVGHRGARDGEQAERCARRLRQGPLDFIQDESPSPSFVVVFSRQMDAVIAGQVQIDSTFGSWRTDPAPGPNDLVWHNVALTTRQRWRKTAGARLRHAHGGLFHGSRQLARRRGLGGRSEIVDALGEGFFKVIVGLILTIFLVVGHILSLVISRQYGLIAASKMDVTGASIYFWLLVFNLYIGNLSERPVWDDVLDWIQNPSLVLHTLILRCVETSSFFLQFCMLRVAQSCPLELIHPPFHLGLSSRPSCTWREQGEAHAQDDSELDRAGEHPLHRVPAQTMMVAFLGIMYCVTAPFFLPSSVCSSASSTSSSSITCATITCSRTSGQTLWAWLVKNTFICLIISQVILLLGLPTLVEDGGSTDYLRLALLPLPSCRRCR